MSRSSRRAAAALIMTLVGGCAGTTTALSTGSRAQWFDQVWSDFDRHYAFFELGHIDWNGLRATYRDSVVAAPTDAAAARLIGAMIGRLHDYHADLTTSFGTFGPPPIGYPHHFNPEVVGANYLAEPIRTTPSGRIQYARLRGGPGYVYIASFEAQGWGNEIEQVLTDLKEIDALVIDIRNNPGGNEDNGIDIAARLYDRPRTYRVSQFRNGPAHGDFAAATATSITPVGAARFSGRVALITNRFNGSSAEDFVLMIRALPTAITVGDTTLGLGSNPLGLRLENGWTYRVPQSMQSTPDGFVYQWRGLPPSIPVAWNEAVVAAGRDPYLDAAIEALGRKT